MWLPAPGTEICPRAALAPETARGFVLRGPGSGDILDVIIWHQGPRLAGFVNICPHLGLPLETFPDRFLSGDGAALVCSAHGAQFDADGQCFAGPCRGKGLLAVALDVNENDAIIFAGLADAPARG